MEKGDKKNVVINEKSLPQTPFQVYPKRWVILIIVVLLNISNGAVSRAIIQIILILSHRLLYSLKN